MSIIAGTIIILLLGMMFLALGEHKLFRGYSSLRTSGLASYSLLSGVVRICGWLMLLGGLSWELLQTPKQETASGPSRFLVFLDCSRSMLAASGIGTSRLELAKETIRRLSAEYPYAEWGLVSSGGVSLVDLLPTADREAFLTAIGDALPSHLLGPGTAWASAWRQAEDLSLGAVGRTVVLLFSDGELNLADFATEEDAWRKRSLPCLFAFCGQEGEGQPIPLPNGKFVSDGDQQPVSSISTAKTLRRLLNLSPVAWLDCKADAKDIAHKLFVLLSEGRQQISGTRQAWPWLFLCGLLLILLDTLGLTRKMSKPALTLCLCLLAGSLQADEQTPRQALEEQLQKLAASPDGQYAPEALAALVATAKLALHQQPGDEEIAACLEWSLVQQESLKDNAQADDAKAETPSSETAENAENPAASPTPGTEVHQEADSGTVKPARTRPRTWRQFLEQQPEVKKARQPFPDW
jgi:hypothetical protein